MVDIYNLKVLLKFPLYITKYIGTKKSSRSTVQPGNIIAKIFATNITKLSPIIILYLLLINIEGFKN